jgi:hypothetical protein
VAIWRRASRRKRLAAALVTAVVAGAALGIQVAAGPSGATALHVTGAAPGSQVTTGRPGGAPAARVIFSALTHGKPLPVASLPRSVQGFIDHVAPMMGMKVATASRRVRLVRTSMGRADFSMYAFLSRRGRPCFYVPRFGGICATTLRSSLPGFYWLIGGGGGGQPSYLMALAADEIRRLSLNAAGENISVSLSKNVAFAAYPVTRAKSATVTALYRNGDTQVASVALR